MHSAEDLQLCLEPTDLVELARSVVRERADDTPRHKLVLAANAHEIVGMFDAPRLERVLDNLIGNAVKYGPLGGEITIDVNADANLGWAGSSSATPASASLRPTCRTSSSRSDEARM